MPSVAQTYPVTEDRAVDIPCIERELRRIWQGTSATADDSNEPVSRVCTLNLVALAPDARSASRASEAGASITARYPCRVIVATMDHDGPDGLDASISAYCHPGGLNDKPICCERISLYASGNAIQQLPWAVLPLLAPDVPVFLWVLGNPRPQDPVYKRLVAQADRLIVDLQSIVQPEVYLPTLAGYYGSARPAASDMAWRRTEPWRDLVASLFDPPPYRSCMGDMRKLQIGYTTGGSGWPQAQAALLAAWVAERLKWQPQSAFQRQGDTWTLPVNTPAGSGTVSLVPFSPLGLAPGDIGFVTFPASGANSTSFTVQRVLNAPLVEARIDRPGEASQFWRRPMPAYDTAWLLGHELERPHGSFAFERVAFFLSWILSEDAEGIWNEPIPD